MSCSHFSQHGCSMLRVASFSFFLLYHTVWIFLSHHPSPTPSQVKQVVCLLLESPIRLHISGVANTHRPTRSLFFSFLSFFFVCFVGGGVFFCFVLNEREHLTKNPSLLPVLLCSVSYDAHATQSHLYTAFTAFIFSANPANTCPKEEESKQCLAEKDDPMLHIPSTIQIPDMSVLPIILMFVSVHSSGCFTG